MISSSASSWNYLTSKNFASNLFINDFQSKKSLFYECSWLVQSQRWAHHSHGSIEGCPGGRSCSGDNSTGAKLGFGKKFLMLYMHNGPSTLEKTPQTCWFKFSMCLKLANDNKSILVWTARLNLFLYLRQLQWEMLEENWPSAEKQD